jgi:antitoxin component YwqK of YwqJK toxin-antitoxin module
MAQKARSHFKVLVFFGLYIGLSSCNTKNTEGPITASSVFVDTSMIPLDTILDLDKNLKLDNGIYYFQSKPYSGYIKEVYDNNTLKSIRSFLNGMQHGIAYTYFPNGKPQAIRSYKANKSFGRHYGYWENGNQKFDFLYINDKREGSNKQWYESGKPYTFLQFKDDKENGMQQAWRENGRPYINYEAKDGFRYGLQKSSLCYTLLNEKLKLKE